MKQPHIYIMTNIKNTTLYIGVTSQLVQRVYQHKSKLTLGFTHKYNLNKLVYFESFETMYDAITREKQLKNWRRAWKENLIEQINPNWLDLSKDL
ncbi:MULTISPECIES: GIY-YIG nuclease family protein [unclassified Colwellia]|uniref:GIY-YIG nuclease family protein n=1 Tax=unclassified Colwellia TaxID=196834 RepID=UPI0015F405A0|nr:MULTISPECIES: GIY-YIG nuclease family protein [unclassified Colwellia]MBA6233477.1 GIY-YIG nuclease family protein [Colwellia sp. MB02u-7]MBA6236567.1 GIY-YIG nuclease family protein [Colwellia sp. MB02u-11]MBA6257101.1 GIY-YIG nuclease family protein [Colwellia sp. MB3u-28]MBA6312142.1 GIY-YIG nuclease family protein [Colwellia sp. MB3u-64]MBA6258667.1 GIY-YIG nuclease family protein [Colwellia sp. MB3u-41]